MKRISLMILLAAITLSGMAQAIGEAFYIYRNDGQFNAFFRDEVQAIEYSYYDADSVKYEEIVTQVVITADSVYKIPLAAIDSVSFNVNEIKISPDYVKMENYSVISADLEKNEFELSFSGEIPDLNKGNVLTIIGETLAEVVRVNQIEKNGNMVKIYAEPASLGDIFVGGSFTLSTESYDAKTPQNNVFSPVAYTYIDNQNQIRHIRLNSSRRAEFVKNLYHIPIDYSGKEFYKNDYLKIYWQKCHMEFNLDLVASFNFNSFEEGFDKWRKGELVMQKAVIRGSLESDFIARFDASYKAEATLEESILQKNIHKPFAVEFLVAGVPVVVTMNCHLYKQGNAEVEGDFSAYTGFATSTSLELGCSWSQTKGLKPYGSFDSSLTIYPPTVEGSAHLDAKFSIFPSITFSLYGLIGPTFNIKPYQRLALDLALYDNLIASNTNDFYGAKFNKYVGYDAAVGISSLSVLGEKPFILSPSWNVAEFQTYEAPKKIVFKEASAEKIEYGKPVQVSFYVTDYDYLKRKECSAYFPMVVKFRTNSGKISNDFAIIDINTGLATITWTPSQYLTSGDTPFLVAMMHDHNGQVIASDRWIPEIDSSVRFSTGNVTHIKSSSAKLHGDIDNYIAESGAIQFAFFYSTEENVHDGQSVQAALESYNELVADITNLKDHTTYYYALAIKRGDADYEFGEVKSFKTLPKIETIDNAVTSHNSVTLYGTCSKGITTAGFSIKKNGETTYTQYGAVPDENGNFSATISGLEANTTYSYYAFVSVDTQKFMGEEYTFTTEQEQMQLCPDDKHPHLIDLGLPSGTKWACCNVGAASPADYGGYFAWGETQAREEFTWGADYALYNTTTFDFDYIGEDIAGTKYDAATANWGDSWQMPNRAQCKELFLSCSYMVKNMNGIDGWEFTGPNGGKIFIPFAGTIEYTRNDWSGYRGFYWTSNNYDSNSVMASGFIFDKDWGWNVSGVEGQNDGHIRCYGETIRPVQPGITVTTGDATEVTVSSATLHGSCSKGISTAGFSVKKEGESEYVQYNAYPDEEGNFSATIEDLDIETKYVYYAFVQTDEKTYKGEELSLSTKPLCPDSNHPHMIDLGLPSGTKWACCNVGASRPEENGNYYAWGDSSEKTEFYMDTYLYQEYSEIAKTVICSYIGEDISGTEYDIALQKWGNPWCMPSKDDYEELMANCKIYEVTYKGEKGTLFVAPNGKNVFMKPQGYRDCCDLHETGQGVYWTSTYSHVDSVTAEWAKYINAYAFQFMGDYVYINGEHSRVYGYAVRPIAK